MYDSNKSKFIEKAELGKMMRDAGMMATAAEVTFVWNIINKFKGKMDSGTFIQWG
jgi:Ca2+-binding EF-hand superfamily protein